MKSITIFPLLLAGCLTLASCAAGTTRDVPVTIFDFRSQNIERLHPGIDRLLGEDSAGVAAREYLGSYTTDLMKHYPVPRDSVAPVERFNDHWGWYRPPNVTSKPPATNPINPDLQTRRFLDYAKGRRMGAMADLQKNHDEYLRTRSVADLKMGLVNAYIAVTAMPSPNDINIIAGLVEPLLAALTKK